MARRYAATLSGMPADKALRLDQQGVQWEWRSAQGKRRFAGVPWLTWHAAVGVLERLLQLVPQPFDCLAAG